MNVKSRKVAAAALGAALLGGGGLTALMTTSASAADSSTSTSASASATTEKPDAWMSGALKKLVSAATLTQAQADAVTKALDAARPQGGPGGGPGHGGPGLTVAAKALGIDESALRTALQSGKTIAAVAKTQNVDINTVISALVTEESSHLAQAVTDGRLTQAQADERKANATERATNMVNGVRPTAPAASASASS